MKKMFAMLLALVMALSFTACGKDEPNPTPTPEPVENTQLPPQSTLQPDTIKKTGVLSESFEEWSPTASDHLSNFLQYKNDLIQFKYDPNWLAIQNDKDAFVAINENDNSLMLMYLYISDELLNDPTHTSGNFTYVEMQEMTIEDMETSILGSLDDGEYQYSILHSNKEILDEYCYACLEVEVIEESNKEKSRMEYIVVAYPDDTGHVFAFTSTEAWFNENGRPYSDLIVAEENLTP